MKRITAMLFAVTLLTGCATHGTNFAMSDVEAMRPGVTTYDEAVAKLGKPKATKYGEDGTKSALWIYASPLGGKGARILFDKDGKMVRLLSKGE